MQGSILIHQSPLAQQPPVDTGALVQELTSLRANNQAFREREHHHDGGHAALTVDSITERGGKVLNRWYEVPFDSAMFTASGAMTWDVSGLTAYSLAFKLFEDEMTVGWYLEPTSVGGVADRFLKILIPEGWRAMLSFAGVHAYTDGGVSSIGACYVERGGSYIFLAWGSRAPIRRRAVAASMPSQSPRRSPRRGALTWRGRR
jgi:hypothetical protein